MHISKVSENDEGRRFWMHYDAGNTLHDFRRKAKLSQDTFVKKCQALAGELGAKRGQLYNIGVEVPNFPEFDPKTNKPNDYGLSKTVMSRYENGEKIPRARQLYFIWVFQQLGILEGIPGLETANKWLDDAENGYLSIDECQIILGEDVAKHYSYTLISLYNLKDLPFHEGDSQSTDWGQSSTSRPRLRLSRDDLVQLLHNPSFEVLISIGTAALLVVVVASIYLYSEQMVQTLRRFTQTATPTAQSIPEVLPTVVETVTDVPTNTPSPTATPSFTPQPTEAAIVELIQTTSPSETPIATSIATATANVVESTSTETAPTATPTVVATQTPTPASEPPCEVEIISPQGTWPVPISFRGVPDGTAGDPRFYQQGTRAFIESVSPDGRWYKVKINDSVLGWADPMYFSGCIQTSQ